jgi:hypothetical protein
MSESNPLNQMPQMPGVVQAAAPALPPLELDTPSHEGLDDKPKINKPDEQSVSNVKVVPSPKKGIEVVATRKGFFRQSRRREGDVFVVPSFELLGDWMKCTDPNLEKQRLQMIKERKSNKANT